MNYLDDREDIELLRKGGCTALEIERLRRLRREYVEDEEEQVLHDGRYPTFVRWLVKLLQEGTPVSAPWW